MPADNWENIINLLTGFSLESRANILDSKGSGGIPWLTDINITGLGRPQPNQTLIQKFSDDHMGATLQFFSGRGQNATLYQADIRFTDQNAGHQYWQRSWEALISLVQKPFTTIGVYSSAGGAPAPEQGVDLTAFPRIAESFDLAYKFFNSNSEELKQWTQWLGDENASWKGTAASVFYDLIHQLHEKYEHFKLELAPSGYQFSATSPSTGNTASTIHGDSLLQAETDLHQAYRQLFNSLLNVMYQRGSSIQVTNPDGIRSDKVIDADPSAVLRDIVRDLILWINEHNTSKTVLRYVPGQYSNSDYVSESNMSEMLTADDYQDSTTWGNLRDMSTWSAIANEAQYRWRTNVEVNLDTPARAEVKTLQENWSRVMNPNWNTAFAFDESSTSSLSQEYQEDKQEIEQQKLEDEAKKNQEELNKQQEESNKQFNDAMNDFGNNVNQGFGDLGNNLNDFGNNLGNGLNNLGNNFGNGLDNLGNDLGNGLNNGLGNLNNLANNLGQGGGDSLGGLPPTTISDDFGNNLPTAESLASDLPTSVSGFGDANSLLSDAAGGGALDPNSLLSDPTSVSGFGSEVGLGSTDSLLSDPNSLLTDPTGTGGALDPNSLLSDPATTTSNPFGNDINTLGNLAGIGSLPLGGGGGTSPTGGPTGTGDPATLTSFGNNSTLNPDGSLTTEFPDGSSTTVSPTGEITTTNPDGTVTTDTLAPGQSLLNPDGSVTSVDANGDITTQFPDGTSVTHNADGSIATLNPDGSLTTDFPDGSSTTVTPEGETATTTPTGISTFGNLNPGDLLTNPDGSTTGIDADGNITTTNPDGSSVTHNADGSITNTDANGVQTTTMPNGVVESTTPDGLTQLTAPNGTVSLQNPDGSLTMDFPDGSSTTIDPDGTVTTNPANGDPVTSQLGEGQSVLNPDGTRTSIGDNGAFTTTYPDGSSVTVNPDGTVTSSLPTNTSIAGGTDIDTSPDFGSGSGSGSDIPTLSTGFGSGSLPSGSGGLTFDNGDGSLSTTFPSGATSTVGADGFTTTTFPDGSSTITSPDGQLQAVPSPETAAANGGVPTGQSLAAGLPSTAPGGATGDDMGMNALGGLMSPMMMMMGMARMAGQGGQQGQGDRTRENYQDPDGDGVFVATSGYRQQPADLSAPEVFSEEDEDPVEVPSRTPTSGHGNGPGDSQGAWRPETQNTGWDEEEDVWGTGEEGLPASIGR
ncbi:AAWKG family protein [Streptomyces sp. NPDC004610]|uniref:AAWKG family protein n=1 Tax=unclassified Streptomyces TaxID=2593676 RepID=UPI0033AC91F6